MTRVAVAQVGSRVFDTPATMQRLRDIVAEASEKQVEFLVFPEAFIGGYPKGLNFGAVVGSRTPEGRDASCATSNRRSVCRARRPRKSANWPHPLA